MLDILKDTFVDIVKLLPFLFITYLIMEYIENKTSEKFKEKIKKSGKFGPIFGGMAGIVPQCGFAASATNLYVTRFISIGTLIAVYLATSDEMLPIFISKSMPLNIILEIFAIKLVFAIFFGFLIDCIFKKITKGEIQEAQDICEQDNCGCHEHGIVKSSLKHTLNIIIYIFIITLIINIVIAKVGQENIEIFIENHKALGPIISSLIGLIPNCAASVIITNLYITNVFNMASLIAGLLTGAGVGLLILFRMNKGHWKENFTIMGLLYFIGVISGLFIQIFI